MARSEESTVTHEDNNNVEQQVTDISDSADSWSSELPGGDETVWFYMDPLEKVQGPFSMNLLRAWGQRGFFDVTFKVWRTGQSRRDAVLLADISLRYRHNELSCLLGSGEASSMKNSKSGMRGSPDEMPSCCLCCVVPDNDSA